MYQLGLRLLEALKALQRRLEGLSFTSSVRLDGRYLDDPSLAALVAAADVRRTQLSVTPVGGRGPGIDQQPIEVAAIADACAAAYRITADPRSLIGVDLACRWFLGENDAATVMFGPATRAGCDGLERAGRNDNQGAESTLAMLSTAQQASRIHDGGQ